MNSPKVIAEIGCNHKGDMQIAKELILTAATYCKADVVNCSLPKNTIRPTLIQPIRTDRRMENIVSF